MADKCTSVSYELDPYMDEDVQNQPECNMDHSQNTDSFPEEMLQGCVREIQ